MHNLCVSTASPALIRLPLFLTLEERFHRTLAGLEEFGIDTELDRVVGLESYQSHHREWEPALRRLASHLGYDWDEVTGDLNSRYAADEHRKQPSIETLK